MLNKKTTIILLLAFCFSLLFVFSASAQPPRGGGDRGGGGGGFNNPTIQSLPDIPCVTKNCPIPSEGGIQGIEDLFAWFYNFGFWIVGFALLASLIWAGVEWILAGPNIGRVAQAKSRITNVILGFILLLSSWLILNTINPNLITSAFRLKPLGGLELGFPGPLGEAPGVIDPIEEVIPAIENCISIQLQGCAGYTNSANCNDNTCSVGGPEGQGCRWNGSACVVADAPPPPPTNGGGGGESCPADMTFLGAARNGGEFCDDLGISATGTVTIKCKDKNVGGFVYVAGPPPKKCPVPIAPGGNEIPNGMTPRCTNIETECLGLTKYTANAFDKNLLGIKQQIECKTGNEEFTINVGGNDYAGAIGDQFTTVVVCK